MQPPGPVRALLTPRARCPRVAGGSGKGEHARRDGHCQGRGARSAFTCGSRDGCNCCCALCTWARARVGTNCWHALLLLGSLYERDQARRGHVVLVFELVGSGRLVKTGAREEKQSWDAGAPSPRARSEQGGCGRQRPGGGARAALQGLKVQPAAVFCRRRCARARRVCRRPRG